LPGVLFSVIADKITSYHIIQPNIILGVFLYYFIGLLVSRVGSLIIEPVLKYVGFIRFSSYSDFVVASKDDSKLELLSEVNNMYRTFIALSFCLILVKYFENLSNKFQFIKDWQVEIFVVSLFILFLFSYRKQTAYINKRISTSVSKD
jgi:hypothetical protein